MERRWPKNIWEYQTLPVRRLDFLRTPLYLLTTLFSEGKITLPSDWEEQMLPEEFKGITLGPDKSAHPLKTNLDYFLMHIGLYWQYACPLVPEKSGEPWQFAFRIPKDSSEENSYDKLSVCSLILEGPVKVLIGPEPVTVYGRTLRGQELRIKKLAPYFINRKDHSNMYPLI